MRNRGSKWGKRGGGQKGVNLLLLKFNFLGFRVLKIGGMEVLENGSVFDLLSNPIFTSTMKI
jgi:hypothetical protein